MSLKLSVVIPTVGRLEELSATLNSLCALPADAPPFEVVVVLDGDHPATGKLLQRPWSLRLQVLSQPRRGAAAARNLGAREACGEYLLLLNDDTRVHPSCLQTHLEAQERLGPAVILGHTAWDPDQPITPYMVWLAPAGHQFNFARLRPHQPIPWDACWTTNLSLPRQWLLEEPLDEAFSGAGMEDSEWGYRLWRRGRVLRYVPEAICWHRHLYQGPRDFRPRAWAAGAGARYVVGKHPSLVWLLACKPILAWVVRLFSLLWPRADRAQALWELDFRWHYLLGLWNRHQPLT
ncbi:MAG: glycosyltransferase [Thermoanaerobaculum sp.]|nr:glycosyltransferase [Thermoanaerobaculum sp.]